MRAEIRRYIHYHLRRQGKTPTLRGQRVCFPATYVDRRLKPHSAIVEFGAPDVVRHIVDRCSVCIKERVPITLRRDVSAAVDSVLFYTTLPSHAARFVPVRQPLKVLDDSTSFVEPLHCWLSLRCEQSFPLCVRLLAPLASLS